MDVWLMINSFHFCRFWELNAKIGRGHATSKEVAWMIDAFIALTWLSNRLSKVNFIHNCVRKNYQINALHDFYISKSLKWKLRFKKSLKKTKTFMLVSKKSYSDLCTFMREFFHALIPLHYVWKPTKKSHFTKLRAKIVTLFWLQL